MKTILFSVLLLIKTVIFAAAIIIDHILGILLFLISLVFITPFIAVFALLDSRKNK